MWKTSVNRPYQNALRGRAYVTATTQPVWTSSRVQSAATGIGAQDRERAVA
jgi:hypothetical protein